MRLRINWQSFFIGFVGMFVALIAPAIGNVFIDLVTKVRDALPWSKKK